MSDELPEGWTNATGEQLFSFVTSGSRGWARYYADDGARFLRVGNLNRDTIALDLRDIQHVLPPSGAEGMRTKVIAGDVLVSITADVGMVGVVQDGMGDAYVNQHLALARPHSDLFSPFVAWYLAAAEGGQAQFFEMDRGAIKAGLSLDDIRSIVVPLAPDAEQRRIVAKVAALLAEVNAARERLSKVPAILKRFRQSVLAAACSGRLTEEWREARSDCDGHVLLRSLLAARESKHKVSKKRAKPVVDQLPVSVAGGEVPDCWALACFDQVSDLITKGSSPSWQGFEYVENGVLFVRSQNVRWGEIDLSERVFVEQRFNEQHASSIIRADDVLLNLVGASVGRAAVATQALDGANCNQAVGIIRPADGGATSRWLSLYLLSPKAQGHIATNKADVARANFNLDDIRAMALPLPSRAEQNEIVRRVESLFKVADAIEKHIASATARADRITQAVLAKAFRGELVPTEAELAREEGREYEPASVLLERIVKERATSGPKESKKRPKRDAA